MNLLKRRLPSTVEVGGISYKIDPRYDTALAILDCMQDELFPEEDRIEMALDMFYVDAMPVHQEVALALMYDFLNMGEEPSSEPIHGDVRQSEPLLDFDKDGNAIYTHFLREFGIDLQDDPIHWWKFQVLLQDIGEKSSLQNMLNIRTMKIEDVPVKDRPRIQALKAEYAVNAPRNSKAHVETLEERNRRWKEG